MNFGKGGQNIVQAGSGNANPFRGAANNILGQYFGTKLRRTERDYHRTKDEESRIRVNEASDMSRVKSNLLEGMMSPMVSGNYFDVANKTLGADHPDVVAGTRQANDFVRPQFAHFVNNFGIQTSKHGILPGQPAKGVLQEEARALRQGDENTKQTSDTEGRATVARFGKDGKMSREPVSLDDIEYGEKTSERPPASMREVDDSSRPSNQNWSAQQKADLEKERPRTSNLNTGINESRKETSNPADHERNVNDAWGAGMITGEEAASLIPGKSRVKDDMAEYSKLFDTDENIQANHERAGLNDKKGTKY